MHPEPCLYHTFLQKLTLTRRELFAFIYAFLIREFNMYIIYTHRLKEINRHPLG